MKSFCNKSDSTYHLWVPLVGIYEGDPNLSPLHYHTDYKYCVACKAICNEFIMISKPENHE